MNCRAFVHRDLRKGNNKKKFRLSKGSNPGPWRKLLRQGGYLRLPNSLKGLEVKLANLLLTLFYYRWSSREQSPPLPPLILPLSRPDSKHVVLDWLRLLLLSVELSCLLQHSGRSRFVRPSRYSK